MSRRPAVQIEEEFDDDTDLPLPTAPLPNTGTRGPLLQELNIDYDDPPTPSPSSAPRQSAPPKQSGGPPSAFGGAGGLGSAGMGSSQNRTTVNSVTDVTPFKTWSCIYPIYIDAKRPYAPGQRRLSREKSVWWPLSKDIADAAQRMGLKVLHEINKTHPRDWENPGRVRIQWKVEGTGVPLNPKITSKTRLLEGICMYIHHIKPENAPRPPYTSDSTSPPLEAASETASLPTSASASAKGKSKATTSTLSTPKALPPSATKRARRHPPSAPHPHPPIAERVSHYSPALESGVLIDAVKAGMTAQEGAAAAGEGAEGAGRGQGGQGIQQKGKRKVIRVRG